MSVPLLVAGSLALVAAGVHGKTGNVVLTVVADPEPDDAVEPAGR